MIRLALTSSDVTKLETYFAAEAPQEAGAFLLLRTAKTAAGIRLVASETYIPNKSEWDRKGANQLRPSAKLISAMVSKAIKANCGLLFVHSHPHPNHPTGFSLADQLALNALSEVMPGLVPGLFAAAVVGPSGWVSEYFSNGRWNIVDRITSAGCGLRMLNPLDTGGPDPLDDRQSRALGRVNALLRSVDVAVVGCGGLGSPLVETLVRMGVKRVILIDDGLLDTPSDIRRVFGSKLSQLGGKEKPSKVSVVGENCQSIGLDTEIVRVFGDVRRQEQLASVLDADIVLCATDTHSSRAVIDAAAYAFHLPVIDCGVRVGVRHGKVLAGLTSEVRICAPGLPCLWCRRTLSAEKIRAENLPEKERKQLERESYVIGQSDPEPSVTALTVFGAGMIACALLALLSEDSCTLPDSYILDGMYGDAPTIKASKRSLPQCICRQRDGKAFDAFLGLMPVEESEDDVRVSNRKTEGILKSASCAKAGQVRDTGITVGNLNK